MRRLIMLGGYPSRLFGFVLATIVAGLVAIAGAGLRLSTGTVSGRELAAIAVLFALTLFTELRPIPVDLEGERLVSLAFVFVVASQVLYSWEWSVLIGACAMGLAQVPSHNSAFKLVFNTSVYAIAAAAASLPALIVPLHGSDAGYFALTSVVFAAGAIFVATNVAFVRVAVALASGRRVTEILVDHLRHSGPAFSIMVFLAAQTVIFWRLSPLLLILVGAPLLTLNLYQRSSIRGRVALRDASTDSLTGLKNHRAYEIEVGAALAAAAESDARQTLCLIDVDRFKQVNDRYGHPAGDAVLRLLGKLIEELAPGDGYRLGGDELAILVPGDTRAATALVGELQARFETRQEGLVPARLTISIGIASFPEHADEAGELKKRADLALYRSKRSGKNRSSVYTADDSVESGVPPVHIELFKDARMRAAEQLVAVVDARDAYVGQHSARVARSVEALGQALGLDEQEVRRLRLAGLLHDIGKIAVPDAILCKPTALEPWELELIRKHPQTAFDLLDGLDLAPVDTWVLHHHERWDGGGYPHGLAGEEIPFGSRLILVADAFDAMTTDRSYGRTRSVEEALAELRDKAGTQFDPGVVAAFIRHISTTEAPREPALASQVSAWSM